MDHLKQFSLLEARVLVVQIAGCMSRGAIFDLSGIAEIAPRIAAACHVNLGCCE